MYLWRRWASQKWWSENETKLRTVAGDDLAVIEKTGRKRLQLEAASSSRGRLQNLKKKFGGRIKKLPPDWLERFTRRKTRPIKVGNMRLIIPAGAAFGTGEHATTAMSLRLLEKVFRNATGDRSIDLLASPLANPRGPSRLRRSTPVGSVVDLGTGSGILALAAKRLGARRVIGIDNDPTAISTAKQNAWSNRINAVRFQLGDVRHWKSRGKVDVVTANLFSELLIEILPKLRAARWLILSGILREQEHGVTRALKRNKIDKLRVQRRGKWVAILAAVR
jgi:ribosomal protein L11 methyltransferase